MKAIIEGRRYNTETATKIGETSSDYGRGDFRHSEEALYLTKRGQFFLAGSGGPLTRWARSVPNGSMGGSGIHLLSETEAREWAESNLSVAEMEAAFAVEEG